MFSFFSLYYMYLYVTLFLYTCHNTNDACAQWLCSYRIHTRKAFGGIFADKDNIRP